MNVARRSSAMECIAALAAVMSWCCNSSGSSGSHSPGNRCSRATCTARSARTAAGLVLSSRTAITIASCAGAVRDVDRCSRNASRPSGSSRSALRHRSMLVRHTIERRHSPRSVDVALAREEHSQTLELDHHGLRHRGDVGHDRDGVAIQAVNIADRHKRDRVSEGGAIQPIVRELDRELLCIAHARHDLGDHLLLCQFALQKAAVLANDRVSLIASQLLEHFVGANHGRP
eukprot:scaffold24393_cov112-Isochrysis_galbana.AAC.6